VVCTEFSGKPCAARQLFKVAIAPLPSSVDVDGSAIAKTAPAESTLERLNFGSAHARALLTARAYRALKGATASGEAGESTDERG
jgi:hypothetical protein